MFMRLFSFICVFVGIKRSFSTTGYTEESVLKLFKKWLYQVDHLATCSGN